MKINDNKKLKQCWNKTKNKTDNHINRYGGN